MTPISSALRRWFVVHFVVDIAFALPLMLVPEWLLGQLGWSVVDPVASRIAAAALFAIGTESYFMRNASPESFRVMLRLKSLWSGAAMIGLAWSAIAGAPPMVWALFAVFVAFAGVWNYYRVQLRQE